MAAESFADAAIYFLLWRKGDQRKPLPALAKMIAGTRTCSVQPDQAQYFINILKKRQNK